MNEVQLFNDLFEMDPLDAAWRRGFLRPWRGEGVARAPQIRVDLSETDKAYTVKADIPGVRKEDIDVRIDGNQVTISAEVKQQKEEKEKGRVLRSERQYGFASRSFTLAHDVNDAEAQAKYADGVLELVLPKKTTASKRKLTIG